MASMEDVEYLWAQAGWYQWSLTIDYDTIDLEKLVPVLMIVCYLHWPVLLPLR